MLLNGTHPLMDWAGFKTVRYDNPGIAAKKELIQVFNERGTETGLERYRGLRRKSPEIVDEYVTNELGYYLRNHGKMDAAIAIFKENAQNYPKSINTFDSLAVTYIFAGKLISPSRRSRKRFNWSRPP